MSTGSIRSSSFFCVCVFSGLLADGHANGKSYGTVGHVSGMLTAMSILCMLLDAACDVKNMKCCHPVKVAVIH